MGCTQGLLVAGHLSAFKNQYRSVLYVVDAQGRIRHRQFGESAYE
jgi:hypothetical protein